MKKLLVVIVLTAVACGYPISPTPQQCQMERFPPPCGCPTNQDPSGFYRPGVAYWPQNPDGLNTCVER